MASPFDNLSDAEILKLVREAGNERPTETPKEKVRFTLGNETIEADTVEEANRIAQEKYAEAIRAASVRPDPQPTAPVGAVPAKEKFNMKTFTDTFVENPDAGLDYLDMTKYGMSTRQAVPQMLGALLALGAKVQELEAASFAPKENVERQAVEQVMKERGWQPSRQSYEDALLIAKGRGLVKDKESKPTVVEMPQTQTFIPPRTPRGTSEESLDLSTEELLVAAQSMPLDKLEDLLRRSGHFKG